MSLEQLTARQQRAVWHLVVNVEDGYSRDAYVSPVTELRPVCDELCELGLAERGGFNGYRLTRSGTALLPPDDEYDD